MLKSPDGVRKMSCNAMRFLNTSIVSLADKMKQLTQTDPAYAK